MLEKLQTITRHATYSMPCILQHTTCTFRPEPSSRSQSLMPKPYAKVLCHSLVSHPYVKTLCQSLMPKPYASALCQSLVSKPCAKALCLSLMSKPSVNALCESSCQPLSGRGWPTLGLNRRVAVKASCQSLMSTSCGVCRGWPTSGPNRPVAGGWSPCTRPSSATEFACHRARPC